MRRHYQPGDHVIFVVSKVSNDPGPRAHDIHPAPNGDTYQYVVEKYWTVRRVGEEGQLELVTRRGKVHFVRLDDPRLRQARWWERWLYHDRFPSLNRFEESASTGPISDEHDSLESSPDSSESHYSSMASHER